MKPTTWWIAGGVLAVVAVILAISLISSGSSPRSYVASKYDRVRSDVYRSDDPPSRVAAEIVDHWSPISQYADGSGVYLRYSGDGIAISPQGRGSSIQVMESRRMYHTYYSHIGGYWGWTSSYGESFRGRGPSGGGK